MIKFLMTFIVLAALVYFGLPFLGYQVNPQNISYYMPNKTAAPSYEIEFKNGTTLKGELIEETPDSVKIDINGAITTFSKLQIQTTRAIKQDMVVQYIETVKLQNKIHPLISKKKGTSGAAALDEGAANGLKQLLQVDKFNQFDKVKQQIKEISAKADERNKQIEAAEKI
jgi:hypothetical protein